MSHFPVTIITKERPSQEDLTKILAPWCEHSEGALDHEVWHDETEEKRAEYDTPRDDFIRMPDGRLLIKLADELFRPATDAEREKLRPFIIGGFGTGGGMTYRADYEHRDEKGMPLPLIHDPEFFGGKTERGFWLEIYPTMEAWLRDYCGYTDENFREDGSVGYMQVADPKWDWWEVGGRWKGMLLPKPDVPPERVGHGTEGLGGAWDDNGVDQIMAGDLDIEKMMRRDADAARAYWKECEDRYVKAGGFKAMSFADARTWYADWCEQAANEQKQKPEADRVPLYRLIENDIEAAHCRSIGVGEPDLAYDLETYVASRAVPSTHAFIKDGVWHERGKMGWFAVLHDEKHGEDDWHRVFGDMLFGLEPTDWITIVDCHI